MSPMMQMTRTFRARVQCRRAVVAVLLTLSCALGWAQDPGSVPMTSPQQGVPQNDMGPRSMPRRGFPPEPNGLPPRPGSPESRLPPTPPTQAPAPAAPQSSPPAATPSLGLSAVPAPTAATPGASGSASTTPHAAQVSFHDGLLEVRANDSSLQQILRSVARRTGMKITGGVSDQRVFGNYGPAPASSVLATLLDGTAVNMLLQTTPAQVPEELVLTPQTGAVTAPNLDLTTNDDPGESPQPAQSLCRSRKRWSRRADRCICKLGSGIGDGVGAGERSATIQQCERKLVEHIADCFHLSDDQLGAAGLAAHTVDDPADRGHCGRAQSAAAGQHHLNHSERSGHAGEHLSATAANAEAATAKAAEWKYAAAVEQL